MTILELKTFLDGLPKSFDEFTVLHSIYIEVEGEDVIGKAMTPINSLIVVENDEELHFHPETEEQIENILTE